MTRYNTLLLDQSQWDLIIDSAGDIAMCEPPYSLSQDVASAVRLFLGELWYSTKKGIPYWDDVLGHLPPPSLLTGYIEKAALSVPGVVSARCVIQKFEGREITGQIQFIDETGASNGVTF